MREFHDRAAGRRFGEKVHLALEAAPPVGAQWPPTSPLPVVWGEGEEARWRAICEQIRASRLWRELRDAEIVGTEFPMRSFRGGWSREERADLVVRFRKDPANGRWAAPGEHWIIDYKTGPREEAREETYREQVRGYMEILTGAWNVPVRGFLWYVETGQAVDVGRGENNRTGGER